MTMTSPGPRLGAIGVDPLPERAYEYLVRSGRGRTLSEISAELGVSARIGRQVLRELQARALAVCTPTRPPAYTANPPELALETLVARRGEELAQIRVFARELQGTFSRAAASGAAADLLEVVVGREQVTRYYLQLVRSARVEVDTLARPPYVAADDDSEMLTAAGAAIERGVLARSVYESEALGETATLNVARRSIAMGVQARATSGLPMTLALFDRRIGLVPLKVDEPAFGALVVYQSALLEALAALFDGIWARAAPLLSSRAGARTGDLDDRSRQVLLLMSAGLKDQSIARTMGMSRRTVQKCVTSAMSTLGARTRFQAALLAFDRGWIGAEPALEHRRP